MNYNFLSTAFQDYGFNSIICIGAKRQGTKRLHEFRQIPQNQLFCNNHFTFHKSHDYYITANSFKTIKRSKNNLFGLHNIVIDLDDHSSSPLTVKESCNELIWRLKRDKEIPAPTYIHYTGRGVQLWYCIKEISSKLYFLWLDAVNRLIDMFKNLLEDNPCITLNVDEGASRNCAGYFRMPGSYNTKTGRITTLIRGDGNIYEIHELLETLPEQEKTNIFPLSPKTNIVKNSCYSKNKAKDSYRSLNFKRIWFIPKLIQSRRAKVGSEMRNNMLFLFYNAAVQIMDRDVAKERTQRINLLFRKPLKELDYIFHYIDSKGFLKFTLHNWFGILGMCGSEIEEYSKKRESNATKKEASRIRREELYRRIEKLDREGCTRKEIHERTGVCNRTIIHVLGYKNGRQVKKHKAQRDHRAGNSYGKIAKDIGMSRSTAWNYSNLRKYKKQQAERKRKKEAELQSRRYQWEHPVTKLFFTEKQLSFSLDAPPL